MTSRCVCAMLDDTVRRVKQNDPAKGRWDVVGEEATVWVDARSLALGIVNEVDGHVVAPLNLCPMRGLPEFMRKPAIMELSARCISRQR